LSESNTNTLSYTEQKQEFKKFLLTQEGYEEMYPYLWEELKEFGYQLLKDSTDTKRSQELLDKIKGLDSIISQLKSE